jgi:hypothetical protein
MSASFPVGESWPLIAVAWIPFAILYGFVGWLTSVLTSGHTHRHRSMIARLRILLPASGLAVSIFGIALSFTCGPAGCHLHPYRPYGIVLSALGLIVFLGGLTLAAAFPPEAPDAG